MNIWKEVLCYLGNVTWSKFNFAGGDVTSPSMPYTNIPNINVCAALCQNHTGCVFYDYGTPGGPKDKQCYLKDTLPASVGNDPEWTTGILNCKDILTTYVHIVTGRNVKSFFESAYLLTLSFMISRD